MNLMESPNSANPATPGNTQIGAILVASGRISAADAERVLQLQEVRGERFGEIAVQLGLLAEDDVRFALAGQFDYPCLEASDDSLSPELVAAYQPFSPVVEQLRALRSQLMLRSFATVDAAKTFVLVSPGRGEGRSFIAANLAIVFSQLGERTLLIDADLRAPRQHELFKLGRNAGLSDLLAGRATVHPVVRIPSLVGLSVLPAGAVPPNPQELLGRPAFAELLRASANAYDVVIIDTSATRHYADAQTVAVRAAGALILARNNMSSMSEVVALSEDLTQSGVTVVGSVLNEG